MKTLKRLHSINNFVAQNWFSQNVTDTLNFEWTNQMNWWASFALARVLNTVHTLPQGPFRGLFWSNSVSCIALGKTVTCEGEGTLEKTAVQDAGVYPKYVEAVIGEGITKVNGWAFDGCISLKSVSIPSTVTYFGEYSFQDTILEEVYIPAKTEFINTLAFNAAHKLTKITVDPENKHYYSVNGIVYNGSTIWIVPAGLKHIDGYADGVTHLGSNSFRWSKIPIVTLPETVKSIGYRAFYYSTLEELHLPSSITYFDNAALMICLDLKKVTISGSNDYVYATDVCFGLGTEDEPTSIFWVSQDCEELEIKETVTSIGYCVLAAATKLKRVNCIGEKNIFRTDCDGTVVWTTDKNDKRILAGVGAVTRIELKDEQTNRIAFFGLASLKNLDTVILHSGIKKLADDAFRDCIKLTSIDFKNCKGVRTMSQFALSGTGNVKLLNWDNCRYIDTSAFWMSMIEEIDISHIVNISTRGFAQCPNLKSVKMRDMELLSEGSFYACPQLTTVTFDSGSTLTTIQSSAFAECVGLTSLTLPNKIVNLQASSFAYNPKLTKIDFMNEDEAYEYSSVDGVIYNKDRTQIIICPSGMVNITLESTTRSIGYNAFYGCTQLYEVVMNDDIARIEQGAFYDCSRIQMIRLPASVEYIGAKAFDSCAKLSKVLYCNSEPCKTIEGNPFPTKPGIYVFENFRNETFGGHSCFKILDQQCNIPTDVFTYVIHNNLYKWDALARSLLMSLGSFLLTSDAL